MASAFLFPGPKLYSSNGRHHFFRLLSTKDSPLLKDLFISSPEMPATFSLIPSQSMTALIIQSINLTHYPTAFAFDSGKSLQSTHPITIT